MHTPVLLQETIDSLSVQPGGRYVDATYGEGGHSREIALRGGTILAIDFDEENVEKHNQKDHENIKLVWGNFADVEKIAKEHSFYPVDGVLFDLGLSMEQINTSGRGFSFKRLDEPLDMRISKSLEQTAADIITNFSEEELYELFAKNSEELNSRALARAVVVARRVGPLRAVRDLVEIISTVGKSEGLMRRIFQALRIEVNHEFENIERGLVGAAAITKKGGHIALITFHPTEDRIVKRWITKNSMKLLFEKPLQAPRDISFERSAKLRVIVI